MNKKVTITDLARKAGVSVTTVSQILNGKEKRFSDKTVEKVKQLQRGMGYVPDYNAQSLIKKNGRTIGIIVPDVGNPYYAKFLKGVQASAIRNNYMPLIFGTNNNLDVETQYLTESIRRAADGMIITAALSDLDYIDNLLNQNDLPYLLVNQDPLLVGDQIDVMDTEGGNLAAEKLVKSGHTKIALVTVKDPAANVVNRESGFKNGLLKYGIEISPENIIEAELSKEGGYEIAKDLLDLDITAVFTINDELALGIYRGLKEAGKKIPDDISVIGYDDIDLATYMSPKLTTVHQPSFELGLKATDLIIKRINNKNLRPQKVILPVTLMDRDSVKNIVK